MSLPQIDPVKGSQNLDKLDTARQKKDVADNAFKAQDWKTALRSYHEALLYVNGVDKQTLPAIAPLPSQVNDESSKTQPRTEADEMIEKIYSNMSACHVKAENWKRALECADKALKKNPDNFKAQFRKGKAQAEMGYVEKAYLTLADLKKKNPADAVTIDAEVGRIKLAEAEREKKHNKKFKGFLSRDKSAASEKATTPAKSTIPSKPTPEQDGDGSSKNAPILVPSGIEEVPSDDEGK